MSLEKRKFTRLKLKEPYSIKLCLYKAKKIIALLPKKDAYFLNISATGMFVVLPELSYAEIKKIKEDNYELAIELSTPYLKKPLKIFGRTAWVEKEEKGGKPVYSAGVYFKGLEEKDKEKILQNMLDLCLHNKGSI